jgi:hypothetical protein
MSDCSQWLYYDRENHIWRFYIKNSGELMYSVMYEEDKWTKENKIDNEVLDFTINVDSEYKIYIIYSIKGGELKYCIWENNQWFGKTLYRFENMGYEISEISINTIGKDTHIFFISRNISKNKQCSLMHFRWSNEKNASQTINYVASINGTYPHYQTEVLNDSSLCLFYISNEANEIVIKLIKYMNQKWGIHKRLYGIIGTNINFITLQHDSNINILNLSKESSIYSLENVIIDNDGRMNSNKIRDSYDELSNYTLFEMDGDLRVMWSEDNKVLYSSFNNGGWSEPDIYTSNLNEQVLTYKYLSLNSEYKNIKARYILGTLPPELKLLLPEDKNKIYINDSTLSSEEGIINSLQSDSEKSKLNKEEDLAMVKKSNTNLERRILDLQMQLQQKQRIIEETEVNFIKLTNAKKKAEEKLNIITDIQQTSIKDLEEMKKQKIARDKADDEFKNKLQALKSENDQLKIELIYEKNKGFVDRIFKKKFDR